MPKAQQQETSKMDAVKAVLNKTTGEVLPECLHKHLPPVVNGTKVGVSVPVVALGGYILYRTLHRLFGSKAESK